MRVTPVTTTSDQEVAAIYDATVRTARRVPALYRALANSPRLLRAWTDLAWPLRHEAKVDRALRELIILRVAVLTGSTYEWQHHVGLAERAGLSAGKITAVRSVTLTEGEFEERELAILRLVDELTRDNEPIPAPMVSDLKHHFTDGEMIELLLTASFYQCVSAMIRVLDINVEDDTLTA